MKPLLRRLRNLRWRWRNWSSASDKAFHDQLFAGQTYDPFSHSYPGYVTIRRFADLAAAHVTQTGVVLDLGCGPGEITCELARRFPETAFVGVDHSAGAIRQASANAQRLGLANVSFVSSDLLSFAPPARVQLITMFDSFHHLTEPVSFVERFSATTDRFFLIEPAGNALGQWRDSHDFDWLASDLDAIREKLDGAFSARPHEAAGHAQNASALSSESAIERRYTYDDFEEFFDGFTLTVTGTSSGLVTYPSSPSHQTDWRAVFGRHVYELYKAVDDRLIDENRDLWSRHWAIAAVRGPRAPRRSPAGSPLRATLTGGGAYGVEYQSYVGPTSAPASSRFEGVLRVRNTGSDSWSSDHEYPTNVSYRWLSVDGVQVTTEQLRTRFPRAVAPGEVVDVAITVRTPDAPGNYLLAVDLVREDVTWFSQRGMPPLRLKFRVAAR